MRRKRGELSLWLLCRTREGEWVSVSALVKCGLPLRGNAVETHRCQFQNRWTCFRWPNASVAISFATEDTLKEGRRVGNQVVRRTPGPSETALRLREGIRQLHRLPTSAPVARFATPSRRGHALEERQLALDMVEGILKSL